jgi:hypothetical protein
MDHDVATVLMGVETLAWAQRRRERSDEIDADVQAVLAAEWANVQLVDRLVAARHSALVLHLNDGQRVQGLCWQVGQDWIGITDGRPYAIPLDRIVTFEGLPPALHEPKRRLRSWTSFLRGLEGSVHVQTSQGVHRGLVTAVAQDHVELDASVVLPYAGITWIRLPRSHHPHGRMDGM